MITGRVGNLPNFIIIGAQRSGTTSLYNYLIQHPLVAPVLLKEVHFFDLNFDRGLLWYLAHFPRLSIKSMITGEASPYYLFHPLVPHRVAQILPNVKLIAVLRNPVDRAFSHYKHERSQGLEPLLWEDAIRKESERIAGEEDKLTQNPAYYSFNHRHYSYLARGRYAEQLRRWLEVFPLEQFLILQSENIFVDPSKALNQCCEFLGIPNVRLEVYKKRNVSAKFTKDNMKNREVLVHYFRPYNQQLFELLGKEFDWNK
jgi:hypothetical protein